MRRAAYHLWLILFLGLTAGLAAVENVTVVSGFYDSNIQDTQSLKFGETRFLLEVGTYPLDRLRIRQVDVIYADRFPDGAEMFRDDLEAFHKMLSDGGVVILLAGPESSQSTLDCFNYLGRRYGFSFLGETAPGEMVPVRVGRGPLDGNVWTCEKGVRFIDLDDPSWAVHYQNAARSEVVGASRPVGKGLIVVLGTLEIDRNLGGRRHNALTLVTWARGEAKSPTPPGRSAFSSGEAAEMPVADSGLGKELEGVVLTNTQIADLSADPSTDLLAERVAYLRRLYRGGDSDEPLAGSSLLIPRPERRFFPRLLHAVDMEGETASLDTFKGNILIVVCWATWSSESIDLLEELKPLVEPVRHRGLFVLGISVDTKCDAVAEYIEEYRFPDRQICEGTGYRSPTALDLKLSRIPRLFLIDRGGRIAATDLPPATLGRALDELIRE